MIHYLKGDATEPCKKPAVIMHVVNNVGAWGAGFVLALSKKWPQPEMAYRSHWRSHEGRDLALGSCHSSQVEKDIWVYNLVAQNGLRSKSNPRPLDYEALELALANASGMLCAPVSIHMPRIGCGLAGGDWSVVGPLVEDALKDFEVFVYDF